MSYERQVGSGLVRVPGKFQTYITNKLSTKIVMPSQIIRVPKQ